jgi:hypothetical protein
VTTNLAGFGCFMQDLIESPQDEGCYTIDRCMRSVEDPVNQLTQNLYIFCAKTRRQSNWVDYTFYTGKPTEEAPTIIVVQMRCFPLLQTKALDPSHRRGQSGYK